MSSVFVPNVGVAHGPTRPERLAVRVLQLGAVAAVLVASTYRIFELDRFFVPKELVLHLTAIAVGLLVLGAVRRTEATRVDLLLAGFLLVSALSAGFATNHWAALRALAITVSGVALFWSARALRDATLARPIVVAVAIAAVVAAVTCLMQVYGVRTDFFSTNRAPGGTLGNRNFIAHLIAFALPALLLSTLRAWRNLGYLLGAGGVALAIGALILTRSRAAWLGVLAVFVVMALGALFSGPVRRDRRYQWRTAALLVIAGAGVAAALLLPNSLDWRSDSPYLETARGVVNYREGSGRGRLIQYGNSLKILLRDPVFGAGPGNWQVAYPRHAADDDPSLDRSEPGTTSNPWPSSDWVAFLAERGLVGASLLALVIVGLVIASWRRLRTARDAEEGLSAVACLATIAGTATVGAFDAVMLLGWPTLLVWVVLGALWTPETGRRIAVAPPLKVVAVAIVAVAAGVGALRSAGQLAAMSIYAGEPGRRGLERAAWLDPGNFRVRMAAARSYGAREDGRCSHALAAHGLLPSSRSASRLAAPCE